MLSGKMPADVLHRITYNVLQYSFKDNVAEGKTLWIRGGNSLRAVAFDGFFALTDSHDHLDYGPPAFFEMSLDDLKVLEKLLRDDNDGQFDLSDLPVSDPDDAFKSMMCDADALAHPSGYLTLGTVDFVALSPDRLRRLSLLKPQKLYPIDLAVFNGPAGTDPVIAFRYGPTARGAIAPVNRDDLKEKFKDGEIW